jgi:hypothetical protein
MDAKDVGQDKRDVRLEGERLEQMRQHMTLAQDQLMSAAEVVLSEIGSEQGAEDVAEISLSITTENHPSGPRACKNIWVVYLGDPEPQIGGSYVDPPGVCSPKKC